MLVIMITLSVPLMDMILNRFLINCCVEREDIHAQLFILYVMLLLSFKGVYMHSTTLVLNSHSLMVYGCLRFIDHLHPTI